MGTPLMIGPTERAALHELRVRANAHPVDIATLAARLATPEGKSKHRDQMTMQTVKLPVAFLVTFSVEVGHPGGTARHMSISVQRDGRLPNPPAVWMVAQALGFTGELEQCTAYMETLQGHGEAINVLQIVRTQQEAHA